MLSLFSEKKNALFQQNIIVGLKNPFNINILLQSIIFKLMFDVNKNKVIKLYNGVITD